MIWLRAIAVWALIMIIESVHGTLRTIFLEPLLGSFRARQLSVFTGCVLIFAVTWLCFRWLRPHKSGPALSIGLVWVLLTVIFEIAVIGPAVGSSMSRMLEDYDIARGGLMAFGLIFMFLTPFIVLRIRGNRS